MITFFKIINLTTTILIFFLGLIVLKRNSKSWINISFFILALFTSIWVFTNYLMFVYQTLFWIRMTYATGSFAMVSYPIWAYIFCKGKKKFIFSLYITGFILFILSLTPLVIKDVITFVDIGIPAVYGNLFFLFVFYILASYISLLVILFTSFKKATGVKKNQMLLMLIGVFLFGISVITFDTILPIFNINSLINLDSPSSLIFVAFNTYAIVKHRFMDIRLIIFRSIIYSFLVFLLGIIYVSVVSYLRSPLQQALGISQAPVFILAGFIIAFGFPLLKKLLTKVTDRWLYKGRYNPDVLLNQIGDITDSVLLLEPLLNSLNSLLHKELRVERIAIVTRDKKSSNFKIQSSKLNIKYQNLVKIVGKKNILVYDELPEEDKIKDKLRKLDISLAVPLTIENKPIGLIVLGSKKSGDAWTQEDIKFLTLISHQIAIAVKNAQFYSKIVSDKQRIANLLEERKELDKLKEEFQAIATHEINTPIAASEGYLSMVLEGKAGKLTPCLKSFVSQAFQGTQRTHSLIKNLISAAEIEHGKISINKMTIDISYLVNEVVYDLQHKAKEKNLQLIFKKTNKSLPSIKADPVLIKEAILNLITNAIKFTNKGKIEVKVATAKAQKEAKTQRGKYIAITVEDTGCGIPKKHLPFIFQKFYQVDTCLTQEQQGTGLGLYVVKSIIDLHKGKIRVQSQPNVGSKFTIILPVLKER